MADKDSVFVRFKDQSGNEFICPIESLIDPENASEDVLDNCVDDGVVGRFAGNIDIQDPE